jgi:hypothetical protein
MNPQIPIWAKEIIQRIFDQLAGSSPYIDDKERLAQMNNRPERSCA